MGTKICTKCNEGKPATAEYFYRDKKGPEGLTARCKVCLSEYGRRWQEKNKEHSKKYRQENREKRAEQQRTRIAASRDRYKAYFRAYYEANKERYREQTRLRDIANKERRAETKRLWAIRNRDHVNAHAREYRRVNPEVFRMIAHRRRARAKQSGVSYSLKDVQRQYAAQRGKCYYCGVKVGDIYHVDHVVPLARGGTNSPENLVIACPPCNQSKSNKLPHEWPQGGRLL